MSDTNILAESIEDIFALLARIHDAKQKVYKDSWRKHGELVSIFANISRKADRLAVIFAPDAELTATPGETLYDTVADLANYALLYISWLQNHTGDADEGFAHSIALMRKTLASSNEGTALFGTTQREYQVTWERSYAVLEALLTGRGARPRTITTRLYYSVAMALPAIQWLAIEKVVMWDTFGKWEAQW